jgi:DNA-binding NarL/FixJ family response regulator
MIRVFIVAPTPALQAGLRAMLAGEGLEVVGAAPATPLAPADLVLLAGENPAASARAVAGEEGVAVVALSDDPRLPGLLRALPLRGWAVVAPDATADELRAAVSAAHQGFVLVPRQLAEQLAGPRMAAAEAPAESLTAREAEVLTLLSEGLPNKQIALRLQISEHTVKFHIASIFAKLGAASRTEAVSIGARQGLITL